MLRLLTARLRALWRRDAIAGEIRDELTFHLDSRIEQFERQGMTREEARRAARERVGNLALYQDRGYDVRGGGLMETIWQDVRYSIRLLRKQPGFTLVAMLTLALGIGASTAIFTVIDAALLRPLPYPDPEQLVEVHIGVERPNRPQPSYYGPSLADIRMWQQSADSPFSAITTWNTVMFGRVADGSDPERVDGIEISESFLTLHGLAPQLGRDFNAEDMREGAPAVVLLGHGYWQRRYAGAPDVVGQTIRLDGTTATIVGVVPPNAEESSIWLPLRVPAGRDQRGSGRSTFARLRPGLTATAAAEQLTATVTPQPGPPGTSPRTTVRLTSLLEDTTVGYRPTVNVIGGAVALILLIACVNVAGLLLARGATRQGELAVRAAIGAGRGRLIRQLLVESVVLSAAGGAVGVLVAWLTLDALVANIPMSLPSNAPAQLNARVLAASALLVMATGVLFGLVPAFRLSRVQLGASLARNSRRHGSTLSRRGGQILIGAEIALAVVLVVGAGLMIRSFARVLNVDLGFDPDAIVTMEITPLDRSVGVHAQFFPALLQALRATPGLEAAGAVDHMPLGGSSTVTSATVDGRDVGIGIRQVLPGYFEAIGIPVTHGRALTDEDQAASPPAVIINEAAAREMFPGAPAVGRQVVLRKQPYTVIGVAGDVKHGGPFGRVSPEAFVPFVPTQSWVDRGQALTVVVRPAGDQRDLGARLRKAAQSVGPRVLIERVRTGAEWMGVRVTTPRRRTVLLGLLGGLGLVLAMVGVLGMTAYSVSRRTQEIGLRIAFGARPGAMVRRMVRDSAVPIVIGTLAGLAAATAATRVITSFLFQTDPIEPVTFAAVALLLVTVGIAAAWVPARRAAHVDPVLALRE